MQTTRTSTKDGRGIEELKNKCKMLCQEKKRGTQILQRSVRRALVKYRQSYEHRIYANKLTGIKIFSQPTAFVISDLITCGERDIALENAIWV